MTSSWFCILQTISYPHSASTILDLIFKVHIEVLRHFQKRFYVTSYLIAAVLLPFCYFEQRRKVITLRSCKQSCSSAESGTKTQNF